MSTRFDIVERMRRWQSETEVPPSYEAPTLLHVDLDLTSDCNYRCRHCGDLARGLLNHGGMAWPILERLIDDMAAMKVQDVSLIGGGEPMLCRHFEAVVSGLGEREISHGVVTNGSQLSDSQLQVLTAHAAWVRVSLDAASPDVYERVHRPQCGTDFRCVVDHVHSMAANMPGRIGIAFLITPINVHEILDAARLARESGAAYIRFRPMHHPRTGIPIVLPRRQEIERQLMEANALTEPSFEVSIGNAFAEGALAQPKCYRRCHVQSLATTIAGDGEIYVCSKWRGEPWARLGNLHEFSLRQIWQSAERLRLIRSLDPSVQCASVYCQAHAINMASAASV